MSVLELSFIERFSQIFRRMDTEFPGEREAAAHALYRLCANEGVKVVDIAIALVNSWQQGEGEVAERKYSDADAAIIFERGVEKGRTENRGCALSANYFDVDGEPHWAEIARFCHESPVFSTLKPNEQDVVENTPTRLARYGSLTRPTEGFLLSIFWKLGGRFK